VLQLLNSRRLGFDSKLLNIVDQSVDFFNVCNDLYVVILMFVFASLSRYSIFGHTNINS